MATCHACGQPIPEPRVCETCGGSITQRNTPLGVLESCTRWCSLGVERKAECVRLTREAGHGREPVRRGR